MTADVIARRAPGRLPFTSAAVAGAICMLAGFVGTVLLHGHTTPTRTSYAATSAGGSGLAAEIARTQQRLRQLPRDDAAWATLGIDYVQQAKATADPTYYPRAAGALARSLRLDRHDNFLAMAGEAALAAARHDFRGALRWARRGLAVDARSALLYGTLTDALTQLGRYDEAAQAARRMELLSPGTPAEARLSYVAELRGDHADAVDFMRRALADAAGPGDVAFARYYLGELALGAGEPRDAMRQFSAGLAVARSDPALREGKARAEAAVGNTAAAARDLAAVVQSVPQPSYVSEYGELLQALGRNAAARRQWQLIRTEERLFRANGVALDSDATLFEADHGDARAAVRIGAAALTTRPFLDTYDAYGWALHRAGRDEAAVVAADTALRTGVRNALFLFHRGEIERSLGRLAAARSDLSAALRLDPTFSPVWAPRARTDLAALRSAA
jgi:tetratricopeptide (TPR) repeat protein